MGSETMSSGSVGIAVKAAHEIGEDYPESKVLQLAFHQAHLQGAAVVRGVRGVRQWRGWAFRLLGGGDSVKMQ